MLTPMLELSWCNKESNVCVIIICGLVSDGRHDVKFLKRYHLAKNWILFTRTPRLASRIRWRVGSRLSNSLWLYCYYALLLRLTVRGYYSRVTWPPCIVFLRQATTRTRTCWIERRWRLWVVLAGRIWDWWTCAKRQTLSLLHVYICINNNKTQSCTHQYNMHTIHYITHIHTHMRTLSYAYINNSKI